jgi:hypothetical protein
LLLEEAGAEQELVEALVSKGTTLIRAGAMEEGLRPAETAASRARALHSPAHIKATVLWS